MIPDLIPIAVKVLPRRHSLGRSTTWTSPVSSALLTGVLLLVLIPLVDGRVSGWPLWSWILLAASVPAGTILAVREVRLPFAVASLSTASNSYRFSTRFGRKTVQGGLAAIFAGLALMLLVLHLAAGPAPGRAAAGRLGPHRVGAT